MGHVAAAQHEHAVAREADRLHGLGNLGVAGLEAQQPPVGAVRGQDLGDPQPAFAVDEGHDLDAARHQRHGFDRPVAALVGDGAVDVERAERKLGLDGAGLDQRVGARHLARKSAELVGVELRRHHDLGPQHAAEGRPGGLLLRLHGGQADALACVRMG